MGEYSPQLVGLKRPIRILGSGISVPQKSISSQDYDLLLQLPAGTVESRTGVKTRYVAQAHETASKLAAQACTLALKNANLKLDDIDCLIAACGTMDQALPYNAALIHHELAIARPIQTLDIGASCLSFLVALDQVSWAISAGHYQKVMIVSSDIASCGLNWSHLESSGIFGDGAAAVIVERGNDNGSEILASNFITLSQGWSFCQIQAGGSRYHPSRINDDSFEELSLFKMDGKNVFKLASSHLPKFIDDLLLKAKLVLDDIDVVIPHQASALAMHHLIHRLGIDKSKVVDIFSAFGNQVSASLPTALHMAFDNKMIHGKQNILLIGTGAGLTLGGMVLRFQ